MGTLGVDDLSQPVVGRTIGAVKLDRIVQFRHQSQR